MNNGWGMVALFCAFSSVIGFCLVAQSCNMLASSISIALIGVGLVVFGVYWLPVAVARMIFVREQRQQQGGAGASEDDKQKEER